MNPLYRSPAYVGCYENDLDAFVPELWAHQGLAVLQENMVMANLVHRDFEDTIAKFGDVVNTRRPGEFKIRRKEDGTPLVQQDAKATNVPVLLDQWFYESFVIRDGEGSKSFQELTELYLRPAMQGIARGVDRAILGRVHAYLGTPAKRVGRLGGLSAANAKDYVLEAREILNVNKAPVDGRRLVLAPAAETAMLKTELFIKANERGDGGSALENATLGRILGFDTYMAQNVNSVLTGADIEALTVTDPYAAEYAGAQNCVVTPENGEYMVVVGNDQPTFITAHVDATSFTLNEPNKYATQDNAVAIRYKSCQVHTSAGKGWSKGVVLDNYTAGKAPQVGQLLAFVSTVDGSPIRHVYTVIEAEDAGATCTVYLDRPLEQTITATNLVFPGPYGSLNLAIHRDALALVTRPLALPDSRMGVMAGIASYNGVGMRVLMQYDINAGGTVVNCDILAGVAVLDSGLCVVVQG